MWRKLHRWIAIIAAAYLINTAVTGSLLAWDELSVRLSGNAPPAPDAPVAPPQALPELGLDAAAQSVYRIAQQITPDAPLTAVSLVMSKGQLVGVATFGGPYPGTITLRAADGEQLLGPPRPSTPRTPVDYHQMLKRLHRGDFIGSFYGRYMSITAGLCLLFLSISGLVMYIEMLKRRSKNGRIKFFWQ